MNYLARRIETGWDEITKVDLPTEMLATNHSLRLAFALSTDIVGIHLKSQRILIIRPFINSSRVGINLKRNKNVPSLEEMSPNEPQHVLDCETPNLRDYSFETFRCPSPAQEISMELMSMEGELSGVVLWHSHEVDILRARTLTFKSPDTSRTSYQCSRPPKPTTMGISQIQLRQLLHCIAESHMKQNCLKVEVLRISSHAGGFLRVLDVGTTLNLFF